MRAALVAVVVVVAVLLSACSIQFGVGNGPPPVHDCVTGPKAPGCA